MPLKDTLLQGARTDLVCHEDWGKLIQIVGTIDGLRIWIKLDILETDLLDV